MEIKTIDKVFYRELGNNLREKRVQLGYSLSYVAGKIGMTRQNYDYIELGMRKIKPATWEKICRVLDMDDRLYLDIKIGL